MRTPPPHGDPTGAADLSALLLLGPTGAGKTPLGDHLEAHGLHGRRCVHYDFGANLRGVAADGCLPATGQPADGMTPSDLAVIRTSLRTGALLTNDQFPIAGRLLRAFAASRGLGRLDLLILNGLPRHAGQARDVDALVHIDAVVLLEADAETIRARLAHDSGGDRVGRVDDGAELVARKLETFRERTLPLVRHYEGLGVPVQRLSVGVATTAAEVAGWIDVT